MYTKKLYLDLRFSRDLDLVRFFFSRDRDLFRLRLRDRVDVFLTTTSSGATDFSFSSDAPFLSDVVPFFSTDASSLISGNAESFFRSRDRDRFLRSRDFVRDLLLRFLSRDRDLRRLSRDFDRLRSRDFERFRSRDRVRVRRRRSRDRDRRLLM